MFRAQGAVLTDEDAIHMIGDDGMDCRHESILALLPQFLLELGIGVEVILGGTFRTPCQEDKLRNRLRGERPSISFRLFK